MSLILLSSVLCPLVIYASTETGESSVPLLQENKYNQADFSIDDIDVDASTMSAVQKIIYNTLSKVNTSVVTVSSYKLSSREFEIIYVNVINDHPELFYVSGTFGYNHNEITDVVTAFQAHYIMTKSEIADAKIIFENGVNTALAQVDDSMNDIQKALTIHDYICNLATYPDLGNEYTNDHDIYHSAYGLFYDGNTVCAGYTLSYSVIMNALGIPCKYVSSREMAHAWNIIQINGNWYNVDITMDEINLVRGTNVLSTHLHNCFLKSDNALKSAYGFWHTDFNAPENITCTDTSFDDYFWNDVNTNIYVVDGNYYYLDFNNSTKKINLIQRDNYGNCQQVNNNTYRSFSISLTSKNTDGTESLSYYISFAKLIKYNGELYMSYFDDSSKIGYIELDTGEIRELCSHASYTFALGIINNELAYLRYDQWRNFNYIPISRKSATMFDYCYQNVLLYCDDNNDGYVNGKDYAAIFKKD